MNSPLIQNAVSFDVEEYYDALNFKKALTGKTLESRVEIGVDRILKTLESQGVKATFFFLGKVAEKKGHLVKKAASMGHEIASHGMSHQTVHELGPKEFRRELKQSKQILENLSSQEVLGFRASTFSITNTSLWALDILGEEGYAYDSSIFPVIHDRYGIPDFPRRPVRILRDGTEGITEFPPLTLRLLNYNLPCGGGGYFRLFPLCITKLAIKKMNRSGWPAVLYLHPWEFDPDQPRHALGGLKTFRHYINLKKTNLRLKALLQAYSFGTMKELAASNGWPAFHLKS